MIQLISCGYNFKHWDGVTIDRPVGAGNYAFVLFKSNSEVILDGKSFVAEKNSYLIFQPSTPHLYRELEKPFVNDWFHCDGTEIQDFLLELNFPLDTPVKAADPLLITKCIMELHSINQLGGPLRDKIIDSDIRTLFMKLRNLLDRPTLPDKTSRYFSQFSELRNELYSSPQTNRSVEKLASCMNLSKSYFQHIYKELFGCSVVIDIINSRLEYAKYLLENSSLSIAAISKMCGYENDTHFMRQFKKFVGFTPSQFKSGRK
ncbi:AraC family transcriptional regulator of arabinose operon [Paenibacillus sp. V4I3]|uniref:AraC family transcriptional regulator n=1 Tax=unclassified Paenibacillus TaxID=185978 RepID=UPI00277F115B|nr:MULTISPECIES: AraC family transcriptional regulator [unclassified Paenibacillus]MDQ0871427.1 AraC family transcriptional regulator of arabinose operon [Paenibacillus sp. V4I3]MDQ0885259.1 AraC family transcriptional regulator of arabinose operon [Paenibacillus sp. V4I9]